MITFFSGQETTNKQNVKVADQSKMDRINFYRKVIEGKYSTDVPPIFSKNKVSEGAEKKSKVI